MLLGSDYSGVFALAGGAAATAVTVAFVAARGARKGDRSVDDYLTLWR